MKVSTFAKKINPINPVRQYGHIQQVNKISKIHDDLYARFLVIEDKITFIHISVDALGFNLEFQDELLNKLEKYYNKKICLVICSTHTHYGGDTNDNDYRKQLMDVFYFALINYKLKEYPNLYYSYKSIDYDEVGKSRISNHQAKTVLGLLEIYDEKEMVASIVNYNTHPTILSATETDYFSSEFPGYVLNKLKNKFPNQFFTYTSGCMGDISTRFTRQSQDYSSVISLGDKLFDKILSLEELKTERHTLSLSYDELIIPVTHSFEEIVINETNLTKRELETIEYGKIVREQLKNNPETLMKAIKISNLNLGAVNIIFVPNELFSDYLNYVNTSKTIVSCYSNGYGPYMLPLNKKIFTYELFTDTFSNETKETIINQFKKWSGV